jgi:hypothetical protein
MPQSLRFCPAMSLEPITAPTLVVGMAGDLYGTEDGARYTAEHIRGARLMS